MRLCYDIETNGLEPDTIHCMVIYNLDNNQTYKFSDVDPAHMGNTRWYKNVTKGRPSSWP